MRASHHRRSLILLGALLDDLQEVLEIALDHLSCLEKLKGKGGIQKIGGGHTHMYVAGIRAHLLGHGGKKGDDIVFDLGLYLGHAPLSVGGLVQDVL